MANIISGIIGASAVLLVAYLREFLSKRTKRRKLRSALRAEIKATDTLNVAEDMLTDDSASNFYTHHDFIPVEVYQSNLTDIGLLSEDEIEDVVDYYTNALIAKEEQAGCAKLFDDDDATLEEKMSAAGTFRSTVSYLEDARENAINVLESHMESVPNEGENENQEATQEDSGDENEGEAESSEDLTVLSTAKEITRDLTEPWRKVWHRTSAVESIMALFLIPVTLISIEATVDSQAWALPLSAETIFQLDILPLAFTSSFVHAGPPYLWGNVHGYLLIMSALFPLAVLAGRKRELLLSSLCNLLLVPFLVSWASLILPSNKSALGFSGVNAAFLGTLIVFIFLAWNSEQKNVHPFWSLAIGLISLAVAFAFAPIVSPRLLFLTKFVAGFGIVGTVLVFLFVRRNGTKSVLSFSPYRNSVLFWGALIGIFGFAGLFVLVPPSTNVLAHLTGFYLGFFLPFSVLVGRTLNKPIVEKAMELRGKR